MLWVIKRSLNSVLLLVGVLVLSNVQAQIITKPAALTLYGNALYSNATSLPYANPNAPKGGRFTQLALGAFDTFNTLINKGNGVEGTEYLFDSLTVASLDEPFARYPLLAQSVTYDSNDASWIIYHLNPAARFSNGKPVQARDVVFTFNTVRTKGTPGIQMYLADIKTVTALNALDVRFDFKSKTNREIALTVGEMAILSADDWQGREFDTVDMRVPLGSGPYTVKAVMNGRSITYARNPHYWGKNLMANLGKYNFDEIKYQYYRSEEIAFEGFKAGQYTFRQENKARNWAKNYNFPAVKQGVVVKQLIPHKNPVSMQALVFNLRKPMFKQLAVRQALDLAFDFEWMNKAIFNGGYTRLQSFFFNSELAATGVPSPAEMAVLNPLLPQLGVSERQEVLMNWRASSSDGSGFNRDNLLKARALLLAAGYRYQAGKLTDSAGKPMHIEVLIAQEALQRVVLPYVRNLQRLGIDAVVRQVDSPQYVERTRHFDFDMIIGQFPQSLSPGNEQLGYFSSQAAKAAGSLNTAGIASPVIDRVLHDLVNAKDRDSLIVQCHVLDRLLLAGHYMVPMYGLPAYRVAYWNEFAMPQRRPNYALGPDFWWVDKAGEKRVNDFLGNIQ